MCVWRWGCLTVLFDVHGVVCVCVGVFDCFTLCESGKIVD